MEQLTLVSHGCLICKVSVHGADLLDTHTLIISAVINLSTMLLNGGI